MGRGMEGGHGRGLLIYTSIESEGTSDLTKDLKILKTRCNWCWCHKGKRKTVEFNVFQIFINMIEFSKKLYLPAPLPIILYEFLAKDFRILI